MLMITGNLVTSQKLIVVKLLHSVHGEAKARVESIEITVRETQ